MPTTTSPQADVKALRMSSLACRPSRAPSRKRCPEGSGSCGAAAAGCSVRSSTGRRPELLWLPAASVATTCGVARMAPGGGEA